MTGRDLLSHACAALTHGGIGARLSLVQAAGAKPPRGFPRCELLNEKDGERLVSCPAAKVITWLASQRRPA